MWYVMLWLSIMYYNVQPLFKSNSPIHYIYIPSKADLFFSDVVLRYRLEWNLVSINHPVLTL